MPYERQSADSSNRLTRSNYKRPSLLKQVRGKPTSSSPVRNGSREPSPTDAPPKSSSDEDEPIIVQTDSKAPSVEKRWERNLRGTRGKDMNRAEIGSSKRETSASRLRNSQAKSASDTVPHTSSALLVNEASNDEDGEPGWMTQSQSPRKKQKTTMYGHKMFNNIHTAKKTQTSSQIIPASQEIKPESSGFRMPRSVGLGDDDLKTDGRGEFLIPAFGDDDLEDTQTKKETTRDRSSLEPPWKPEESAERDQSVNGSNFKTPLDIDFKADQELQTQFEAAKSLFMPPPNTILDSTGSSPKHKSFSVPPGVIQVAPNASTSSSTASLHTSYDVPIFDEPETHDSSSSLSSPGSVNFSQQEREEFDADIATHSTAKCPMCKQPVLRSLLEQWQSEKKTTVRHQREFCKAHRKSDAENAWKNKRYPTIDWASFEKRIKKHFPLLRKISRGDAPSFYRNALESSIKSGADRTLHKTIMGGGGEKLAAGYYGPKGTQRMTAAIISDFASLLRRLSTTDRLLSSSVSGGVPQFVQMVLVPELTVLLVKEDMGVDDEGAKEVIQESEMVGMEVNAEEDAEVRDLEMVLREDELRREGERAKRDMDL